MFSVVEVIFWVRCLLLFVRTVLGLERLLKTFDPVGFEQTGRSHLHFLLLFDHLLLLLFQLLLLSQPLQVVLLNYLLLLYFVLNFRLLHTGICQSCRFLLVHVRLPFYYFKQIKLKPLRQHLVDHSHLDYVRIYMVGQSRTHVFALLFIRFVLLVFIRGSCLICLRRVSV